MNEITMFFTIIC